MSYLLKDLPNHFTLTYDVGKIDWDGAMWAIINADVDIDTTKALVADLAAVRDYIAERELNPLGVLKLPKFDEETGDIGMIYLAYAKTDGTEYMAPDAVIDALMHLNEVKALGPAGMHIDLDGAGMRMVMRMIAQDNGFTFNG